jgi:glycosyltransferase involved in cell wall biosynthesis
MNIVFLTSVHPDHAVGGAERMAALLAQQLQAMGHRVTLLVLGAIGSPTQQSLSAAQLAVWSIPLVQCYDPYAPQPAHLPQPGRLHKALWHLRDVHNTAMASQVGHVLDALRPEIVLTHAVQGFSTAVWGAVRARGIKLVHMVHDHALVCPATTMARGTTVCPSPCWQCAGYGALRKWLSVRPDACVAPSQSVLQRHLDLGWFTQVPVRAVIPNALPDDWPLPRAAHRPAQPLVFGFLGRMDESKGIDTLLAAVSHLPPARFQLKVAGAGDIERVRQQWLAPQAAPAVAFLGPVQAPAFLESIDVLVVPSRAQETFSNVVMEASALGRPSIVAQCGALPERVLHGQSGWLFPPGDALALAGVMRACIDQPDSVIAKGQAAFAMRAGYGARLQSQRFERLFMQVLGQDSGQNSGQNSEKTTGESAREGSRKSSVPAAATPPRRA